MDNKLKRRIGMLLLAGTLLSPAARADADLENRLRDQLRATNQQLQNAQIEQSKALAERNAAQAQLQTARQEIAQLQARLGQSQGQARELAAREEAVRSAAESQVAASQQQVEKFRSAYDELLQLARGREAARLDLQRSAQQTRQALDICRQKNQQLYALGKEVLAAYEGLSTGSILQMRQPFATSSRVRFDEIAQSYGDRLYENRADARNTVSTPETPANHSETRE
ncbi:DNA repair protein [Brenneria izadpanahii]|uniref:DNA repair protein n=1 Tax=Brenneria izadpanahii TaxID=2722756 RepID=A0ABX7UX20_9GAMM|nr:hypothetical protein [Brenneria izadpanahii]QTF08705.1 DNA repair protein [Brenneria izadpanahii]